MKIDKGFVLGIEDDLSDRTIVRSVISMAHDLGLKVVAEGIETEDAFQILDEFGCDVGQGYLFGRPMNAADFAEWMQHSQWARPGKTEAGDKAAETRASSANILKFNPKEA